ncbi:MAG: tetratricopeptide repeat protein [Bacteriovoracaceae bacterium]
MRFHWFLIIFLFASCSTVSKKEKVDVVSSLKDNDWVEDAEFKELAQTKYVLGQDYFDGGDIKSSALALETLDRLGEPKVSVSKDKELDAALSNCYQGNLSEALTLLDELYKKYKTNPSYWNTLGSCYLLHNEEKKALLFYNKAKNIDRNYVPAINNLGVIYLKRGKDQKALETFKQATRIKGSSKTPHFNYSFLQLRYGLHKEACSRFKSFYQSSPNDIDILNALGTCELLDNNLSQSISFFEKIDSDFYSRADISLNYAIALKLSGKKDDAIDIFEEIEEEILNKHREYFQVVRNFLERN